MTALRPLALAAALVSASGACLVYEGTDGGTDGGTGKVGSGVAGRILVAGAASVSADNLETRRQVAKAMGIATIPSTASDPGAPTTNAPAALARTPAFDARKAPPSTSKRTLEWMPGELMVQMEKRVYNRETLVHVVARMLDEAGEPPYGVVVKSCTAGVLCLIGVHDTDGKPLSLPKTRDLEDALNPVRAPGIKVVSANYLKYAQRVPNDAFYYDGQRWHYEWARLPAAWDISVGNPNMVVAVIDTGLVVNHPDIANRVAPGVDMISDPGIGGDGNGRDTDPTDVGDQSWGNGQSSFHGSHVAGVIGAETDNGEGVAGVTWEGRVLPIRVLGIGTAGSSFDILSGLYWSVGEADIDDVPVNQNPARVVNMSLGGPATPNDSQVWAENTAIILQQDAALYGNPVLLVAAGNEDQTTENMTPANIAGLIVVGASRFDGRRATYSNWGATVSFLAPGGETSLDQNQDGYPDGIYSLYNSGFVFQQGTSMATPHVSGIAALLLDVNPGLDHFGVLQILQTTANVAGQCNEGCGTGHVDAAAALLQAGGTALPTPFLAVDRSRVFFPKDTNTASLLVYNTGTGTLPFTAEIVGPQAGLFSVSPPSSTVPTQSTITLSLTLNRANFESGSANLRILGSGEAANQEVYVDLNFIDVPVTQARPVNVVRVAAFKKSVDGTEFTQVGEPAITRADDDFSYEIWGLNIGDYYVFGVGDDNNDGLFDPQTESFGAWPVASNPQAVPVAADFTLYSEVNFGLTGGLVLETSGGVGAPCANDADCTFAANATCVTDWNGGYCTRQCDDGYCGANGSCEELSCGNEACFVCLLTCVSDTQCRVGDGFVCDNYQTCTPDGF